MAGATTTVTAEFLGVENVRQQMNVLGRAGAQFSSDLTSKLGKMFGAVAIGTLAFSKMEQSISKNMATAKTVSSLAIKFNVDPSQVHSMKIAADDAGVSIRSLMMASKQFGKVAGESLSNKDAANNMKQLGINAEKLAEMQAKPMKFLPEAAVALASIADENERAAAGAFLFGRQYQQISPLLEKLGTDEEARGKFLSNNNAMTNEQIKLNKESARIQSELSEGWDKFMASAAKPLNWVMSFVSYLSQALAVQVEMIANAEKLKEGKTQEKEGQSMYHATNYLEGVALRTNATAAKVVKGIAGGLSDEQVGITEEQRDEYNKVYAAGGVEKYVSKQLKLVDDIGKSDRQRTAIREDHASSGGDATPAFIPQTEESRASREQIDPKFLKSLGHDGAENLSSEGLKKMRRQLAIASAASTVSQGLVRTAGITNDDEGVTYKNPLGELAKETLEGGRAKSASATAAAEQYALGARQALSRLGGMEYDKQTGKDYTHEAYAELMRARAHDSQKGVGTFNESKAAEAARKKEKSQTRALEKSERHMKETGLSPLEKAESSLEDVRGDIVPVQEDIVEKAGEERDAINRLTTNKSKLFEMNKKQEDADANGQAALAALKKQIAANNELSGPDEQYQLTAEDEQALLQKYKLSADELEKIQQLGGAIKGDEKLLTRTTGERVEFQTKLNSLKSQESAAIDAVARAAEAQWAKERGLAKDAHDDDKSYEREMQELKYKNMKNTGKSSIAILKEKYNYELKQYGEASKEKDTLDAEVAAKQKVRADAAYKAVIEAQEFGDNTELTEEEAKKAGAKAGKMTDEEVAATKQAREKKDKGRQDLSAAVYAFDGIKPQAVVSDLGKMGGGAAVQFGNNPIDEIRKSNNFLKAIEKNTSTGSIKSVQSFNAKGALVDSKALFGVDTPN